MTAVTELFDALAPDYDEHFAAVHRRAYDDLAWELTLAAIPPAPAVVVDAGCGVGRWAERLIDLGYEVIGIEPAPAMADAAARRLPDGFRLERARMEDVVIPAGSADVVLAMGSLQYADDAPATVSRLAEWLRPGGVLCVLVDSLVALVVELLHSGREAEAMERLMTRRGVWEQHGRIAELQLFEAPSLCAAFSAADVDVTIRAGLLVGASVLGREQLIERLSADYLTALQQERSLAQYPALADLGKQLYVAGRRRAPQAPRPAP